MDHFGQVDEALDAIATAKKVIKRGKTRQVQSAEEKDHMRTVAALWFRSLRPGIAPFAEPSDLAEVDTPLRRVFDATAKAATRTTYVDSLGEARKCLLALRKNLPTEIVAPTVATSDDKPPDFSPLASDVRMQGIMSRRWRECVICLDSGASLASVVMMGGLLESLFVSKANHLQDKSVLAKATRAPKHKGKVIPFQDWTLNHYIEVGHELGWIGDIAKTVSGVLRDYRNFIHPQAEARQKTNIQEQDARILWEVSKALVRELLAS